MHLGNEALTSECIALTAAAAGAGLAVAAVGFRRELPTKDKLLLAGGLGALMFAAQAINVPVWPGISGHLVGGVLLAWAVGPGLGTWIMALILLLQAVLLGDGAIASLGANILNMGLLPAGLVAIGNRRVKAAERSTGPIAVAGLAAALSVPLAAVLIVGETALFRPGTELVGWGDFAVRMIGMHLWIGLAEGGLTLALAAALAWLGSKAEQPTWRPAFASLAIGLTLALVTPWSSDLPDGYEAAAERSGVDHILTE